jgi:phosphocarrier protein
LPEVVLTIRNAVGLHARPAVLFVQAAQRFQADIRVIKGEAGANAKSFRSVLALGVNQNDSVTVRADGGDAEAALAALAELVEKNFGEK